MRETQPCYMRNRIESSLYIACLALIWGSVDGQVARSLIAQSCKSECENVK